MGFRVRDLGTLPWIQLFVSPKCNLWCEYCSHQLSHPRQRSSSPGNRRDFLSDSEFLDLIETIPPTHFYISGGEPLIHPGIKDFVARLGLNGHVVSFDTNIQLPLDRIRTLLRAWKREWFAFFNISHHLVCDVSLSYILERCSLLSDFGLPHFVKYVGVPERLAEIHSHMLDLGEHGIGSAVTILQGTWNGRQLPRDYTLDETLTLLDMVTLDTHGLQIFDGVHMPKAPCRGGQDFVAINMNQRGEMIPCCHGTDYPRSIEETFFKTGSHEPIACPIGDCLGDMMFIYGINGLLDESKRLDDLCHGTSEFVGADSVAACVREIVRRGFSLVNMEKFSEAERALVSACPG
ncbi:MAG: radical SAM protein [Planctomycetota bacterium]|jgi:pyruvate-formate lyase-activating enzyme